MLVTLIYLAFQVRQANTWNRQQGFRDCQGRIIDWVEHVTSSKEIAHLYTCGCANYEDLGEDERFRFDFIQVQRWAGFELLWDYHRGGSVKDELLGFVDRQLRLDLSKPGIRQWWLNAGRTIFASDFRDCADHVLQKGDEEPRS